MERLKSKTTLLVALVLAAVLAMAGVGYALAAPDSGSYEYTIGDTTNSYEYGSAYPQISISVNNGVLILHTDDTFNNPALYLDLFNTFEEANAPNSIPISREFVFDGNGNIEISMSDYGIGTYYLAFHNGLDGTGIVPITIAEPTSQPAISDNSISNVAFNFNFKATGIQATGFNDYKEAFAALNN